MISPPLRSRPPCGVAVDSRGNVYVGEASTGRRLQKFVPVG